MAPDGSDRMHPTSDIIPRHFFGAAKGITIPKIVPGLLLAVAIGPCLSAVPAQAQAMRTFVSGSGKDGNPCTATSPCQTFQRALAMTLAGGEISALNSANYG